MIFRVVNDRKWEGEEQERGAPTPAGCTLLHFRPFEKTRGISPVEHMGNESSSLIYI
jgi:hypothetical protein